MADVYCMAEVTENEGDYDSDGSNIMTITSEEEDEEESIDKADSDQIDVDELLSPVARLEKYSDNDRTYNRQIVARNIVDTLRSVIGNKEDISTILTILQKLSNDPECCVRVEVMEQVPHIAVFCSEYADELGYVINRYLVPLVVQYFTDPGDQVRKTSQAALLVLYEQGLIDEAVIEYQICPVIFQLIEPDNMDNYKTEGVALMIKLASLVSMDCAVKLFLDRFISLCSDSLYPVRKVCVANFADFCNTVGVEITEKVLLPKFYDLSEDSVWEVRKACSEVFMSVSCACSLRTRKNDLAIHFVNLLCDQSRWVKVSAFQTLGPFISTFADPSITGLYFKDNGILCVDESVVNASNNSLCSDLDMENKSDNQTSQVSSSQSSGVVIKSAINMDLSNESDVTIKHYMFDPYTKNLDNDESDFETSIEERLAESRSKADDVDETSPSTGCANSPDKVCDLNPSDEIISTLENLVADFEQNPWKLDTITSMPNTNSLKSYDSFNYWRVPLPQIELDKSIIECKEKENAPNIESLSDNLEKSSISERSNNFLISGTNQKMFRVNTFDADSAIGTLPSGFSSPYTVQSPQSNSLIAQQQIVPQDLLIRYVSMTDPSYITTIETDITMHCAYSIPAVALTLGRIYWPCIKGTYEVLSSDIQWKVRYTLASSIHELALILGEDIACKDLVPIFNGFIKDLDEVRIGILQHLSEFLKFLRPQHRREYLPTFAEFIKTDNTKNWRFRHELAQQLLQFPDLYSPEEIKEYIVPITLCLVNDKVSEVRKKAYQVMAVILKHVALDMDLAKPVLYDLTTQFCRSSRWLRRQIYASLCQSFLEHQSVSDSIYSSEVLPHLLDLSWDPVPNVRIAVAQCISQQVLESEFLTSSDLKYHNYLLDAVKVLQNDSDRDVSYFAHSRNSLVENYEIQNHFIEPV